MSRRSLLFVLVAVAQLSVPAWMILGHEHVRRAGEVFKFRTAPVDPRDPFRGEYVRLDFEAENGRWPLPPIKTGTGNHRHHAYALLGTDSAGFANIAQLVQEQPSEGAFVPVEYMYWENDTIFNVSLPFDRYYLEEGDGPRTEHLLMPQWNPDTATMALPAYAVVRVLEGRTVITDLVVGDKSIHEWLKEAPRGTPLSEPFQEPAMEPDPTATSAPAGS